MPLLAPQLVVQMLGADPRLVPGLAVLRQVILVSAPPLATQFSTPKRTCRWPHRHSCALSSAKSARSPLCSQQRSFACAAVTTLTAPLMKSQSAVTEAAAMTAE